MPNRVKPLLPLAFFGFEGVALGLPRQTTEEEGEEGEERVDRFSTGGRQVVDDGKAEEESEETLEDLRALRNVRNANMWGS